MEEHDCANCGGPCDCDADDCEGCSPDCQEALLDSLDAEDDEEWQ